jgi:hypothetical protein
MGEEGAESSWGKLFSSLQLSLHLLLAKFVH